MMELYYFVLGIHCSKFSGPGAQYDYYRYRGDYGTNRADYMKNGDYMEYGGDITTSQKDYGIAGTGTDYGNNFGADQFGVGFDFEDYGNADSRPDVASRDYSSSPGRHRHLSSDKGCINRDQFQASS